jgi:hypothetical protein
VSLGDINTRAWSFRLGVGRRDTDLVLYNTSIVAVYPNERTPGAMRQDASLAYSAIHW